MDDELILDAILKELRETSHPAKPAKPRPAYDTSPVMLTLDGVTLSRSEWAASRNMSADVLRKRLLRGMDLRTALNTPAAPAKISNCRGDRAAIRHYLRLAKMGKCTDCGRTYHPEAMDFDHVRGEKLFELSSSGGRTLAAVRAEREKCDLVCSNCHRVRTVKRRKSHKFVN